jgi:hypothetical protein
VVVGVVVYSYPLRLPKTGTRYFWWLSILLLLFDTVADNSCKTPVPLARKESFVSVLW